jgi:hypothetical protein
MTVLTKAARERERRSPRDYGLANDAGLVYGVLSVQPAIELDLDFNVPTAQTLVSGYSGPFLLSGFLIPSFKRSSSGLESKIENTI